ncbi:hypothetical protein SDC9_60104 [bioreactor metagenome]|uniref:Uncharacterized protein n=1 Tax=bioreactor metagenome TaxID=1076179 RepID=A0A644XC27_9ZZZZ
METALDHYKGEDYITYCTDEKKWLRKLKWQAEQYPDHVKIIEENPDGGLVVHLPYSWFKAPAPPKKVGPMSEERRAASAERLAKARADKKHNESI